MKNIDFAFPGVLKRRSELILPWILFQAFACTLFIVILIIAYMCPNDFLNRHMNTDNYCRCKFFVERLVFRFHYNSVDSRVPRIADLIYEHDVLDVGPEILQGIENVEEAHWGSRYTDTISRGKNDSGLLSFSLAISFKENIFFVSEGTIPLPQGEHVRWQWRIQAPAIWTKSKLHCLNENQSKKYMYLCG